MAALDTYERGDLALLAGFPDFSSSGSQNHVVRMFADLFAYGIDLHKRAVHGFRTSDFARDPDRKENRAQIAFSHSRNVDAARGAARSQIEFSVEKALRCDIVRIHHDG